jgi:hypothetical protein
MIRSLLLVFVILLAAFGLGQKGTSLVGKWVADSKAAADRMTKDISITFRKDGTMSFTGFNTKGEGTYKLAGKKVTISLSKRNGVKPGEREASTTLEVAENGAALLVDTGHMIDGKPQPTRLVRAK